MMKEVIIKTNKETSILIESGSRIEDYYFFPYWFKKIGENKFELLQLGKLPQELVSLIEKDREFLNPQSEIPIIKKDWLNYPHKQSEIEFPDEH